MIVVMFSMGDTELVAGDRNADVSRGKNNVGHRTQYREIGHDIMS